mmetsp:Transcript_36713/g.97217  ORF Transcript_36713/g.97217 Transcript_36713/m.97217 type:complete len:84 (+) Transcript_36713:1328-1579(+)
MDAHGAPSLPRVVFAFAMGPDKFVVHGGNSDPLANAVNVDPSLSYGDVYEACPCPHSVTTSRNYHSAPLIFPSLPPSNVTPPD